jgi:hypothetical protein
MSQNENEAVDNYLHEILLVEHFVLPIEVMFPFERVDIRHMPLINTITD